MQSKFIVMSDPVAGKEDEYNHWYEHQHLGDGWATPTPHAAVRFSPTPAPRATAEPVRA